MSPHTPTATATATATATQSPASCNSSNIRPFVPRKRGTRRQRLGCETCRFRRKKCDNTYPICGHCTRLHLACKFEEPRVLVPDLDLGNINQSLVPTSKKSLPPRDSVAYYMPKVPDIKSLSPGYNLERGEDKRHMLSYYTSVLAVILTTTNSNNSFLSVFLPMAMDSRALQNSLMAWSSAHISSYSKSHTVMALEHRSQALLASSQALVHCSRSRADLEVMLAVCLVLCSMEIVLGDTEHWYQHLVGAKEIIVSAHNNSISGGLLSGRQSNDSRWLLRNFAYHDIIGSLTTLQPPLLPGNYWIEEDTTVIDSYMGIGTEILAMLSKVCSLDTCQNSIDKSEKAAFWLDSEKLEADLQRWSCNDFSDLCLVKLVQAQRSTSLIVLYRKQRIYCDNNELEAWRLPAINSKIGAAVRESIYHMQQIDLDSLPAAGLLWPLFIAGGDAIEAHHCEAVRSLLQGMFNRRGFGNTIRAMEVLDELWRLRLNGFKGTGGRPLDWIDVLKKKGWKLMLS